MEITQEQIVEALSTNQELLTGVTSHIIGTDKGKEIVTNRANQIYNENFGVEVDNIHSRYSQDAFEVLGEKPEVDNNGNKVKASDFIKSKLSELKKLREIKESLSVDKEVARLTEENAKLKEEGGGGHWKQTFDIEKQKWSSEKEDLTSKLNDLNKNLYTSAVQSNIEAGRAGLKFNPDIPESAINAMYETVKADLIKNSKKDGETIVFLREDGSAITDAEYKPADASFILKERMKDVLLKNDVTGGKAQEHIVGSIKTTTVDGKDTKALVLDKTKFTNRVEFQNVAKEALKAEGLTRNDPEYLSLLDDAYKSYKVDELPRS